MSTTLDPDDLDRPEWNSLLQNYSKHDIGEAYFQGRLEQAGLHIEHWGIDKRHHDDHLIFDNKMDLRLWEPLDGQDEPPEEWPADDFEGYIYATDETGPTVPPLAIDGQDPKPQTINEVQWELRGVGDVKTKSNADWMGNFNLRHLAHYAQWADVYDVPVFVYMTMVDPDAEAVGEEEFFVPIGADWEWRTLLDHYDGDENHTYGEMKDIARTCPGVARTFRAPDGNLVVEVAEECKYDWDWAETHLL